MLFLITRYSLLARKPDPCDILFYNLTDLNALKNSFWERLLRKNNQHKFLTKLCHSKSRFVLLHNKDWNMIWGYCMSSPISTSVDVKIDWKDRGRLIVLIKLQSFYFVKYWIACILPSKISLIHLSPTYPLAHPPTDSLTHSLTHSHTHSFYTAKPACKGHSWDPAKSVL